MGNEEWGKCGVSIGQNPIQTDRQTDKVYGAQMVACLHSVRAHRT